MVHAEQSSRLQKDLKARNYNYSRQSTDYVCAEELPTQSECVAIGMQMTMHN